MPHPLQIYLDSSDLSALSDTDRYQREPDLEAIRKKLERHVELGDVCIRLSFVHIVEMINRDASSKNKALERAEFAKSISRENYFHYSQELYLRDAFHYLDIKSPTIGGDLPFPDYAFASTGDWLPKIDDLTIDIERETRQSIQNALKNMALPRPNRKALEKQFLKNGNLTKKSIELLSSERESLIESLSHRYPITKKFWEEDLLFKYFLGKVSSQTISTELKAGMSDPVNLISWVIDSTENGRELPGWLRNLGESINANVYGLRDKVQNLWDLGHKAGYTEKQIKGKAKNAIPSIEGLRSNILDREYSDNRKCLNSLGVKHSFWKAEILRSKLGSLPSFDCYISALYTYLQEESTSIQQPRELSPSDAGDLTHATYMPYADIYRTDRHMAHRLRNLGSQYNTTIVKQLRKLPDTVDKMLST